MTAASPTANETTGVAIDAALADAIGGREEQQDRGIILGDGPSRMLVVADGLGGHRDGARAAELVAETASQAWRNAAGDIDDAQAFLEGVRDAAHAAIAELAENRDRAPMSTCIMLYLDARRASWVWVGDSRLYRFRDGRMVARTKDHSVAQMLLDEGHITEDEMATRPEQSQLLSALGGDKPPVAATGIAKVSDGDGFVLCSDGFWETIQPTEVAAALAEPDLQAATRDLVALAAERGGPKGDNITAALARVSVPAARDKGGWGQLFDIPTRISETLTDAVRRNIGAASSRDKETGK